MGSSNTYPIDTDVTTSKRTDSTVDYEKNTYTSGDIDSSSDDSNLGNNGQNSLTDNQGDISHDDGRVPESNDRNENGNNNGMTDEKPSSTVPDHSDDNDSDSSSTSGNDGNKESSETDKSDNTESVTDGIQSGDSVTISSISESTVTVTIGSETVVIPFRQPFLTAGLQSPALFLIRFADIQSVHPLCSIILKADHSAVLL